jgi:GNAT superfamily N-acetyltransferase
MLIVCEKIKDLSFSQLMMVYEEGNRENAEEFWPDMEEGQRMIRAEQEFYQYLREVFFSTEHARYYVWEENGNYVCALRLEPYRDGMLLEALETHPGHRRMGYAARLIRAVQETGGFAKIYSHVGKRNTPSLAVHGKCGFARIREFAAYIDGSVDHRACTLRWTMG